MISGSFVGMRGDPRTGSAYVDAPALLRSIVRRPRVAFVCVRCRARSRGPTHGHRGRGAKARRFRRHGLRLGGERHVCVAEQWPPDVPQPRPGLSESDLHGGHLGRGPRSVPRAAGAGVQESPDLRDRAGHHLPGRAADRRARTIGGEVAAAGAAVIEPVSEHQPTGRNPRASTPN